MKRIKALFIAALLLNLIMAAGVSEARNPPGGIGAHSVCQKQRVHPRLRHHRQVVRVAHWHRHQARLARYRW